jgi:signal peptidase I
MVSKSIRIVKVLLLLAVVGFAAAWVLLLRPSFLGGDVTYITVQGTSMQPTLSTGDLAIVRHQDRYNVGDIVAFHAAGAIVIHRIISGSAEEGYTVQGDNKEVPDIWRPSGEDILGRMWFSIPWGGRVFAILRQPLILGSVVGGLGMLAVLSGGLGKPVSSSGTSPSKPRGASVEVCSRIRSTLGSVLAAGLTRLAGLLRKRDRGGLS